MKEQVNFEKQCNETKYWLREIAEEMRCPGKINWAFSALKAVLYTLRDRTTIQEVFHFSAQLPVLIRGIYFEGYKPAGKPVKMNSQEFMSQIKKLMGPSVDVPAAEAFRAVIIVLYNRTSHGEMDDIKGLMPKDIQKLWANLMSKEETELD
jgi:uncharacterized protein (DUF2267 family)